MCNLLVDVQIEVGTFDVDSGGAEQEVSCSEGRVIIAATAWQVWPTNHAASVVTLTEGDPTGSVTITAVGDPGGISTKTVHYYLTTARVVPLSA